MIFEHFFHSVSARYVSCEQSVHTSAVKPPFSTICALVGPSEDAHETSYECNNMYMTCTRAHERRYKNDQPYMGL